MASLRLTISTPSSFGVVGQNHERPNDAGQQIITSNQDPESDETTGTLESFGDLNGR